MARELFFEGEKLDNALRAARLLHRLTGKIIYVSEDFEEPWGFFVGTEPPIHSGCLYDKFGGDEND